MAFDTLTWVLVFILAVTHGAERLCMETIRDISTHIPGEWQEGEGYRFKGHFARDLNATDWYRNACPAQSRMFSCYRRDVNLSEGKRSAVENRRFTPTGCRLTDFSPAGFLTALRGRHLMLCCDSVSVQFFTFVACSLHDAALTTYDLRWWNLAKKMGLEACSLPRGRLCHLVSGWVYYPEFDARISLLSTNKFHLNGKLHGLNRLEEYLAWGKLRPLDDILLLNYGLHFRDASEYQEALRPIAEQYTSMDPGSRPVLVWRENSPQHFDTHGRVPAGGYLSSGTGSGQCVPWPNYTAAFEEDFHQRVPEQVFQPHNISILRVHDASASQWDTHMGRQASDDRGGYDCTHFCDTSSVFHHWLELLFNAIAALNTGRLQRDAMPQPSMT